MGVKCGLSYLGKNIRQGYSKNRRLMKTFEPKRKEVTGKSPKICNK